VEASYDKGTAEPRRHSLFYYPYATFRADQVALLQAAALYFDKLYILDPWEASSERDVDRREPALIAPGAELLASNGILELIKPSAVLGRFEQPMVDAIHRDLGDRDFVELCRRESGARSWSLALAKVPESLETGERGAEDKAMQRILRGPHGKVENPLGRFEYGEGDPLSVVIDEGERWGQAQREAEAKAATDVYDEVWYEDVWGETSRTIEYRAASYPVEVGESIMLNHAIFASLGLTGATPVTDDRFHQQALTHKLQRALTSPGVAEFVDADSVRANMLALAALTDAELERPAMAVEIPLEQVLAYRESHRPELDAAREAIAWLAREIEPAPLDGNFAETIKRKSIPEVRKKLKEAEAAQRSWLKKRKGALYKLTGLSAGQLAAVIGLAFAAMPPLAVAAAGIAGAVAAGAGALPAIQTLRRGSRDQAELQYFIELRPSSG